MKIVTLTVTLVAFTFPLLVGAQEENRQVQSVHTDEQIILGQIMTGKRAIYGQALQLTEAESRAFWPVYDVYEAKVKQIDDRFVELIDDYAAKYATLTDADAQHLLAAKMKIDRDRLELQQSYTKKLARTLPPIKALRYAQVESRIDNELQRKVMLVVPLVPGNAGPARVESSGSRSDVF